MSSFTAWVEVQQHVTYCVFNTRSNIRPLHAAFSGLIPLFFVFWSNAAHDQHTFTKYEVHFSGSLVQIHTGIMRWSSKLNLTFLPFFSFSLSLSLRARGPTKIAESAFSLYYRKVKTGFECIKEQENKWKSLFETGEDLFFDYAVYIKLHLRCRFPPLSHPLLRVALAPFL